MLLKPNIKLNRITDISTDLLKKYGIKALILDVDNTLSTHHGEVLTEGLEDWLEAMGKNGIGLVILSNSKRKRVEPFAAKIGLPFISMGLKPLPFKFSSALKLLGTKRCETAIVGDQIFTDTLGGNLYGVTTILLDPIKLETSKSFKFKRKIERAVYKIYRIKNTEVE